MTQKFTKNISYDRPIPLPHHLYPGSHVQSAKHNYMWLDWEATIFCYDCESKIWILKFFFS